MAPARSHFFISLAACASPSPVSQQPTRMQPHRQLTFTASQEPLAPLSSHCKETISYLAPVHSPPHAFQRVLSLPSQGLHSHGAQGSGASSCEGLTRGALPKQSEHVTSIPFIPALFVSGDSELPFPVFEPPLVKKSFNRMAC